MPINTPYSFSLDIVKQTKIPYMQFYQTDVNTSQMSISITNNDEVVDLTGHTVLVNINKTDGTKIQNVVTIEDATNGLLKLILTTQSLTSIGECIVQLTIFDGTNRKSVHEIKYYVLPSMLDLTVPESVNEYGWLLQLIGQVQTVENILNTSEAERVQAENTRIESENNRVILKGQLDTLKDDLESLQDTLNTLNTNTTNAEATRNTNEEARQTLKGQLEELQTNLTILKGQLETLDTNVSNNETTRQSQEADRQALKGQLEELQDTLEALESTLNTNDTSRNTTFNTKVTEVNSKIAEATNSITDIENRFALLQTSQQQASEVINARTSTTKAKTFVSLGARIEETEQNILTSQATSVVDSVVPVNTLANSLDGATDLTIKGMSLVQLVKNGNFVNTNGWGGNASTLTVSNNIASFIGNGVASSPNISLQTGYKLKGVANKKVYIKATARVTNSNCIKLQCYLYTSGGTTQYLPHIYAPTQNQWYTFSGIVTMPSDFDGKDIALHLLQEYADSTTANGKVMEVSNVMALDLTATGLDTKTADEINAMLPSYFEGIASVEGGVIKSIGENIVDIANTPFFKNNPSNITMVVDGGRTCWKLSNLSLMLNQVVFNRFSPNIQYSFRSIGKSNGNGGRLKINYTDGTFSTFLFGNTDNTYGEKTFTTTNGKSVLNVTFDYGSNFDTYIDINAFQINVGSVVKPYQAYRESKIQLADYIDAQYFPLRSVSPTVYDEVNASGKLYKRIDKTRFIPTNLTTSNTNVDIVRMSKTSVMKGYNVASADWSLLGTLQELKVGSGFDNTVNIGKYSTAISSAWIDIIVAKGTYATLQQAIDYYNANSTDFIYQLATPTEITLSRPINIPIFKNGTIIQEPSKMFSKLSYTFPLNMGRSVESIVNNLAWIKDNQQFIMSYLLELDTRLTLGGH